MKLKDSVCSMLPGIPEELRGKILFASTFPLEKHEAEIFSLALQAIITQLKKDKIEFDSLTNVNAIFTNKGDISLSFNEGTLGTHLALSIYAVGLWRELGYNDAQKILVFIEELCHHYWQIEDEVKVKYKIHEIFSIISPGYKIEDLFKMESLK